MRVLVRASLAVRRALRHGEGLLLIGGLATWLVAGGFGGLSGHRAPLGSTTGGAPGGPSVGGFGLVDGVDAAAMLVWTWAVARRLARRFRIAGEAPFLVDFELGALLVLGLCGALLRAEHSLSGRLAPLLFVLTALVTAFARTAAGLLVVAFLWTLEAAVARWHGPPRSMESLLLHGGFLFAFPVLNLVFLRGEVARLRLTARARLDGELVALQEEARSYRLLGAGEESAQDARSEENLTRSSVEEIHVSVRFALDLLRRTLDLDGVLLLVLNDAGTHLRVCEASTAILEFETAPIPASDGVMGIALDRREAITLSGLRPSHSVPHHSGPCPIAACCVLPLVEDQTPMGVLVMDRCDDRPFTPHEQEVGAQAARFLMRAIRNERLFVQLERRKVEQGRLYRAVQALAGARSEEDVITAAATAAKDIANVDQVGITLFDEQTKTHVVCAVRSRRDELEPLLGCTFAHNTGLVSMAVENRFPLPYRGEFDAATQVVLTKRAPWPHVPSLLVLPLFTADRTLGTLVLGSRSRNAFHPQVRPTLEVLASHLAVSLAHARMLSELEAKATTDGLTGLLNKRAMTELAQQKLAAAERFQRPLSVLIVDADHFKRVNDTYGHDVGDLVLKGLGAILRQQKRATDVVARFGGEEFVALCEQTDEQGAVLLAERIREELARTTFATVHGAVRVTCSIGVATYPQGGRTWAELFKTADLNLYAAKRNGRNRTVADADAAPPGRAARKGATGRTPLAPSAQPKTQTRSAGTSGGRKGAQR